MGLLPIPCAVYTFTTEEYGDLISQYDGADTLFHQYDGLGSTDALLDEWETATDRYAYRAFGLEDARSGTTDNPFTYGGARSRLFHARLMAFG